MSSTLACENNLLKKDPDDKDSNNVIDLLSSSGNYQHVIERLFEHFSGSDIHNFRCVSRSWRDTVLNMRELQITRRDWEKKLTSQWETGIPKETMLFNVKAQVLKIEMSRTELFVDVLGQPGIFVFDITTSEFKYAIRAASDKNSCWDVHKDFLLVFDGSIFYIWDRHTHQEIEVLDFHEMQLGNHFKPTNDDADDGDNDKRIEYSSKVLRKDMDRPVVIKIYPDPDKKGGGIGILVVYCSGIASRWSYQAVYQETEDGEKHVLEDMRLSRKSSVDIGDIHTEQYSFMNPGELFIQLPQNSGCAKLFHCSRMNLVSVDYSLKDDSHSVISRLEGVEDIIYFYESDILPTGSSDSPSNEEYILLTRYNKYVQHRFEMERLRMRRMYEQGDVEGSLEEWLDNQVVQSSDFQDEKLKYLEIHSSKGSFTLLRRMKVHNLCHKGACLNDEHMIISTFGPPQMLLYNTKEILTDKDYCERNGLNYLVNPVPIRTFEYEHGISRRCLYMAGPNRLVFADQVVQVLRQLRIGFCSYTKTEEKYEGVVKSLDFWMTSHS